MEVGEGDGGEVSYVGEVVEDGDEEDGDEGVVVEGFDGIFYFVDDVEGVVEVGVGENDVVEGVV